MIWKDGYTAAYYITLVDSKSWRDIGRMKVAGGTIERIATDLMESADLDMTELPGIGEAWVRIWLDADQNGVTHVPLFTGLTSAPSRSINGRRNTYRVECYSVLKPLDDILLERGFYIPAGVNAPKAAARLLKAGPAPVVVEGSGTMPRLTESVVAEEGETKLTLAWKVLNAIGWRIRIDGRGVIHIEERSNSVVSMFDANANDIIELNLTDECDWFSCPNVLRSISDYLTAVARDDDPASPFSTVSRGREIWAEETSVALGTNEALSTYAVRRLKELQSPAQTVSYNRRFDPDVKVGDLVRINHPEIGIDGTFEITTQTLKLSYGCRTEEEAFRV